MSCKNQLIATAQYSPLSALAVRKVSVFFMSWFEHLTDVPEALMCIRVYAMGGRTKTLKVYTIIHFIVSLYHHF